MTFSGSDQHIEENTIVRSHLNYIVINSDENYILVDADYKVITLSPQFKVQYLKYFGKEVTSGMSLLDLTLKERVEYLKGVLDKAILGEEQITEIEIDYCNEVVIIQNKFKPAIDDGGNKIGLFITSTDITSLRKAESEKKELERQAEFERQNILAVINNSKSLIWSFDQDYRLLIFNDAFVNKVQKSIGHVPKRGDYFLNYNVLNDKVERFKLYANRAFNGESYTVVEHIFDPKDIWLEISFNPIRDQNKITGIACTVSDITERKVFEKSLIQSKNKLKQAQEIAHVGHWELDFKTKAAKWSDESYKIYGIDPRNFDHSFDSWMKFIHPEDLDHVKAIIQKGYETLKDYSVYHRIIRPNGEIRYIYGETHFEFDSKGKPKGLQGISQDITERKNNEIHLQQSLNTSNKLNKWLNNFTHIVSHNLKAHNTNISGIVNIMDGVTDKEELSTLLNLLRNSTNKLDETIKNLADYISLQNNIEQSYQKINLRNEIDKTCSVINQLIIETDARIENQVDKELELKVIPSYLESILLNIINNAIKYRSKERAPMIKLSNFKEDNFDCLKIEDNGIGIDMNKFGKHVFGMFQTFHGNQDAVGFGLFITRNQIEAMEGKIDIESTPGKGTTFTIYFNEKS